MSQPGKQMCGKASVKSYYRVTLESPSCMLL